MKNYVDHSRFINAVVAVIFSVCVLLPLVSYAEAQSKSLASSEVATKISINKADSQDLLSLKGIGVKKAQAIIDYRKAHGEFNSLDELVKVKGIGTKVISDNKAVLSLN